MRLFYPRLSQPGRNSKYFTLDQEVYMIHVEEDNKGLDHVQLDDFYTDDYYFPDKVDQTMDVMMTFNVTDANKIEYKDDVQKEHYKQRNAQRAKRRCRVTE
jgi:hypothetical protein